MCWTVSAVDDDAAFAWRRQACALSGAPPIAFGATVRDICYGTDGALAGIDADGFIRVRDGTGDEWSPPAPPPQAGLPSRSGWRLLAADGKSVTVWNPSPRMRHGRPAEGEILRLSRFGEQIRLGRLSADTEAALAFGGSRFLVACPERGIGLAKMGADNPEPAIVGVSTRAETIATDGRRIVVSAGKRVAGYDLLESVAEREHGAISLRATLSGRACRITLPDGSIIELSREALEALRGTQAGVASEALDDIGEAEAIPAGEVREFAARVLARGTDLAVRQQSVLVADGRRVGDQIWHNGVRPGLGAARAIEPESAGSPRPGTVTRKQNTDVPWSYASLAFSAGMV